MKNKTAYDKKTSRYPLRAAARRLLRAQTDRDERIFHCHAAFLAALGLSAVDEEVPGSEFRVPSSSGTRGAEARTTTDYCGRRRTRSDAPDHARPTDY